MHTNILATSSWCFVEAPENQTPQWENALSAEVPGNVVLDLHRHGLLPEPFFAENFRACQWAAERTFWYATEFPTPTNLKEHDRWELTFPGIDTFGEVFLNGKSLGRVHNMFRRHVFTLTAQELDQPNNRLEVRIDPCIEATRQWMKEASISTEGLNVAFGISERLAARKMQMSYGWDNTPHILAGGIFRPVVLKPAPLARLINPWWNVESLDVARKRATLAIGGEVESDCEIDLQLTCGDQTIHLVEQAKQGRWSTVLKIENAQIWWPNGMGEHPIYALQINTGSQGKVACNQKLQVALRTVKVQTEPARDAWVNHELPVRSNTGLDGGMLGAWTRIVLPEPKKVQIRPMQFVVNGIDVFIRGANWQCPDVFPGRVSDTQITTLLNAAADANMNMIRIWGGGCVEKEVFYETCAARGLMVFQDFFFACGQYPEAPAFLDEITTEIQDIILRLRVHPAIAAWCGDNERDMIDAQAGKDINKNPVNKRIIPQTLNTLDSQHRYYHTSSPSGGDCPRSEWQGDRRNWGPWHPDDNYAHIRLDLGRFISEGGNYALPNRETVRAFIPPSLEWPLTRKTWRLHTGDLDFAERRFDRLNTDCWAHFANLKNLDQAIEVSQFAQGLGMSRLAEHCRIRKGECGGVVLWKINDCWPSVDSGLIDYSLQPRAGLAAIAQAYEPVAIAMENPIEGEHTSEVEIWGLNDILTDVEGHLKWQCWKMTDSGFDLDEEQTCPVSLPANASTLLCRLPIKTQRTDELAWTAQLQLSDGTVRNTMYSLAPRTIYHLTQWQATGKQLQEAHTL